MEKVQYSFDELSLSSTLIRSLINEKQEVSDFSHRFFSEQSIISQTRLKSFSTANRSILNHVLKAQNQKLALSSKTTANIDKLLESNTFTITTGHQLNMATGPLYTLYKILEVINWCEKMNESQNENNFVPVFWMATEDHDFDEINHIHLFGQKIDWQHQDVENSVVGRISTSPTNSFIKTILEKFNDENMKAKVHEFLQAYEHGKSLSEANRELINSLFGSYGLVILDGDDRALKELFVPIIKEEIENSVTFNSVSKTNQSLEAGGFHQQVYVRQSNLFYIEPSGERVRIERTDQGFLMKEKMLTAADLLALLAENPERFSPNALMRPLYQETVLPNVAYIGGGGEIAYWLQLRSTFEKFNTIFPLLKVRESILLIDDRMKGQMTEFGYSVTDLKMAPEALMKDYVTKNQTVELSLTDQKTNLDKIKGEVVEKALAVDKNATAFIEAEFQRMQNQFEKMEKKFIASEKKNQEKSLKQLQRLQNRLYPNGGFQERYDNYLSYIHLEGFIDRLKSQLKQRMTAKAAIQVIEV